jgi:hypothetical protein
MAAAQPQATPGDHTIMIAVRKVGRKFKDGFKNRADIASSVIILVLIAVGGVVFAWILAPPLAPSGAPPPLGLTHECASAAPSSGSAAAQPVKVSDASGSTAALNLFISRGGDDQTRQSVPLAIQKGKLCPNGILTTSMSDLVRSDGQTLPRDQFASWGQVDSTGTHVTIRVRVNPRYLHVSGFGMYSGIASLNDSLALGASVPVEVHVLYPNISFVLAFSLIAAFGGFTWAWLLNDIHRDPKEARESNTNKLFWRNMIIRIAVLLAAAIPIVNAQVLANPDWSGDLTQYIALATIAGAAAIALTPTLRALAFPPSRPPSADVGGRTPNEVISAK